MVQIISERPLVARDAIPFAHWSMRSFRSGPAWGAIVAQLADLEQGVANLCLTPIGSVVGNPLKGVDIAPYIDLPITVAAPILKSKIWEGLTYWHPRIVLESVDVFRNEAIQDFTAYIADIVWRPREGVLQSFQTLVSLDSVQFRTQAASANTTIAGVAA